MICPTCKGGKTLLKKVQGKGCYEVVFGICEQCHGSGEVEMTNEEWLRQCTTEQLAEYLWRSKKSYWSPYLEDTDKMEIEDMLWWLKQPHT